MNSGDILGAIFLVVMGLLICAWAILAKEKK